MKHLSFYDPKTGALTGSQFGSNDEAAIAANAKRGPCVDGQHDHRTHRVDLKTLRVVPKDTAHEPTEIERHHAAIDRIRSLEGRQARVVRELLLGDAGAKEGLQAIDDEIAKLRGELQCPPK